MIRLAWRNVWRNRRRSALTALSIACGLAALMLGESLMKTVQRQMVEKSTGIMLGHLQAQSAEGRDPKVPERAYPRPRALEARLRSDPRVRALSARLVCTGLAYSAAGSRGVLVIGVEPATERQLSTIPTYLKEGRYLSGERDLVLGDRLAAVLDVRVGEKLVVMAQGPGAEMSNELFRVSGIYHSGSESYDEQVLYIPLAAAQRLRGVPGQVSYLIAALHDFQAAGLVARELAGAAASEGARLLTFHQIGLEVEGIIRFEDAVLTVVLLIICLIVGLGILNTVSMSMFERVREFGVIRALGARRSALARMVTAEALLLGAVGTAAGLALGLCIIGWCGAHGLPLPVGKALSYWIPFEPVVYLRPTWRLHFVSALCLLVVSVMAAAVPAVRAARLVIAEALREL